MIRTRALRYGPARFHISFAANAIRLQGLVPYLQYILGYEFV